ncbi:unnamed protein product [Zymoseptoria tritici ST99CH_3D7]|uniref:Uncharacterized protein n=1 Tax=Zymoseptoria tritici (strain ST99CH_3D7) TaxID=1276538 RepID=A0A1X7RUZ5_ZYMT9|nr:unnamed protein product [Zymoseptoria tritici ST99CH_3D7]
MFEGVQNLQHFTDNRPQWFRVERRNRSFQQPGPRIETWHSVTRTRDQSKQLRCRVHKVEDLGDEQEEQGLAEVSQDAHHGEQHACEIAQRKRDSDERQQQVDAEQM